MFVPLIPTHQPSALKLESQRKVLAVATAPFRTSPCSSSSPADDDQPAPNRNRIGEGMACRTPRTNHLVNRRRAWSKAYRRTVQHRR
jgi:hypothetical protein